MGDDETPVAPSGKPYHPASWQPEDGDPFAGNGYDKTQNAIGDALRDGLPRRGLESEAYSSPLGFLIDVVYRYFFPRSR